MTGWLDECRRGGTGKRGKRRATGSSAAPQGPSLPVWRSSIPPGIHPSTHASILLYHNQSLARAELSGPAPAPLASGEDGDVAHARFYAWWELGEPHEGAAVRARFADGRPFLLTRRAALGSATLLTAGLNGRDNNLIVLLALLFGEMLLQRRFV